ncbi:Tyrosine kinase-like (TKL) protein [Toxoplasma gondii FOU]|uniref:Tyrosine kinase-like (TKL) protein n=3 Tax=Toxoplasma gondii TaxID=5811 RepID=A0A086LEQ4_TOXGO|nr:Tyrosine kinase-like (TKL) protein [Toxoplasma gondii FOU]PUA91205.1 Tyrosine kinase-like (TKL) protein [Toxoplasma gondii TgCATBr9]RQX74585.1 Tyrosine kinase-like (TKL) protein [Toxoplasma gondii CAST]
METGPPGVKQRDNEVEAVDARNMEKPVKGDNMNDDGENASGSTEDDALNDISLEYSYEELYAATAGFSVILGQGAYGNVYEGVLRDGVAVAVKWLHKPREAGFEKEVQVLSKFRHPHLVILLGFARHGKDRFLVYELLSGGDVGMRLQKGPLLSWQDRLSLALDSASALSHLQHHSPQVYHRDIKTANILLDKHNSAKVADFGLACLAKKGENGCAVKQTAGTIGYADPKYISSAVVTEMTEVYSFGMVLLELLTARPPAVLNADGSISYLLSTIGTSIRRTLGYIDPRARFPPHLAQSLAILAFSCIQADERHRPPFRSIVQQLQLLCTAANLHPCPSLALGRAVAAAAAAAAAASGADAKAGKALCSSPPLLPGVSFDAAASREAKAMRKMIRVTGRRDSRGEYRERERHDKQDNECDDASDSSSMKCALGNGCSRAAHAASDELAFLGSPPRVGRGFKLEAKRLSNRKTRMDGFAKECGGTRIKASEATASRKGVDGGAQREERTRVVSGCRRESQEENEAKRGDNVLGQAREQIAEQTSKGSLTIQMNQRNGDGRTLLRSPRFAPDETASEKSEHGNNWQLQRNDSGNTGRCSSYASSLAASTRSSAATEDGQPACGREAAPPLSPAAGPSDDSPSQLSQREREDATVERDSKLDSGNVELKSPIVRPPHPMIGSSLPFHSNGDEATYVADPTATASGVSPKSHSIGSLASQSNYTKGSRLRIVSRQPLAGSLPSSRRADCAPWTSCVNPGGPSRESCPSCTPEAPSRVSPDEGSEEEFEAFSPSEEPSACDSRKLSAVAKSVPSLEANHPREFLCHEPAEASHVPFATSSDGRHACTTPASSTCSKYSPFGFRQLSWDSVRSAESLRCACGHRAVTLSSRPGNSRSGTASSSQPLAAGSQGEAVASDAENSSPGATLPNRRGFTAEPGRDFPGGRVTDHERVGEGASHCQLRRNCTAPSFRADTCEKHVVSRAEVPRYLHKGSSTRTFHDERGNLPREANEDMHEPPHADSLAPKVPLAFSKTEKPSGGRSRGVLVCDVPGAFPGEPPPGLPPRHFDGTQVVCCHKTIRRELDCLSGQCGEPRDSLKRQDCSPGVTQEGIEEDKHEAHEPYQQRSVWFCMCAEREGDGESSFPGGCACQRHTVGSCSGEPSPVNTWEDKAVSRSHHQAVPAPRISRYEEAKDLPRAKPCCERPAGRKATSASHNPQGLSSCAERFRGDEGESSVFPTSPDFHRGSPRTVGETTQSAFSLSSGKGLCVVSESDTAQGSTCVPPLPHCTNTVQLVSPDQRATLATSPLLSGACAAHCHYSSLRPGSACQLTEGTGGSTSSTAPATPPINAGSACNSARGEGKQLNNGTAGTLRVSPDMCPHFSKEKGDTVTPLHADTVSSSERAQSGLLESEKPPPSAFSPEPSMEVLKRHSDFLGDVSGGPPPTTVALASGDLSQPASAAPGVLGDTSTCRPKSVASHLPQLSVRGSAGGTPPCLVESKNSGTGPKTIRLPHTLAVASATGTPLELEEPANDGDVSPKKPLSRESISRAEGHPEHNDADAQTSEATKYEKVDIPFSEDEEATALHSLSPAPCDTTMHKENELADAPHVLNRQPLTVSWRSFAMWSDWGRLWSCPASTQATSTEEPSEMATNEGKADQTFGDFPVSVPKELPGDDVGSAGWVDSGGDPLTHEGENLLNCNDKTGDEPVCITQGDSSLNAGEETDGGPIPKGATAEAADRGQETPDALSLVQKPTVHDVPVTRGPEGFRDFIASLFSGRQQPEVSTTDPIEPGHPDAFCQSPAPLSSDFQFTSEIPSSFSSPTSGIFSRKAQVQRLNTSSCSYLATPCNEQTSRTPCAASPRPGHFILSPSDGPKFDVVQGESCLKDSAPGTTEGAVSGAESNERIQDVHTDKHRHACSSSVDLERGEANERGAQEEEAREGCGQSKKGMNGSGAHCKTFVRALSGPKTLRQIQGRGVLSFETASVDDAPEAQEVRAEKARRFLAGEVADEPGASNQTTAKREGRRDGE